MPPKKLPPMQGVFEEADETKAAKFKSNRTVRQALARVRLDKTKKKPGKPFKLSPRQIYNGINSYFTFCEDNDRTPSIRGMMLHMKLSPDSFYRTYGQNDAYIDILMKARTSIEEWVANDIYQTPGQAAGKIAYAKNLHGWSEKLDTTNINETTVKTVLSIEDAKAKIASLAHLISPELLQAISGKYVQDQITTAEVIEIVKK